VLSAFVSIHLTFKRSTVEGILEEDHSPPWAPEFYAQKFEWYIEKDDLDVFGDDEFSKKCKEYIVSNYNCTVAEYAPRVFCHIRHLDDIADHDIAEYLTI